LIWQIIYQILALQQQSTFDFPDKDKLKQLFEQAGFNKIKIRSFTGGLDALQQRHL
jgi:ubiquinone/menaquinone biosynthesis C-methylase UbiE